MCIRDRGCPTPSHIWSCGSVGADYLVLGSKTEEMTQTGHSLYSKYVDGVIGLGMRQKKEKLKTESQSLDLNPWIQ